MDQCPVLPATDGNISVIVMAAAIVTGVGFIAMVLARRRMLPVLVAMLVSLVVALGVPAQAASNCPPPPIAATLSPTTTSTSPTTTSILPTTTTTSPTASTTTTVTTTSIPTSTTSPTPSPSPGSAPIAEDDGPLLVAAGERVNLNVLANDDLGTPHATITGHSFDAAQVGCRGLSFDPGTGVLSGTATSGACIFSYIVSNWAPDHATVTLLIS
jgi:hypothetical protein